MSWQSSVFNLLLRVCFKARVANKPFPAARKTFATLLKLAAALLRVPSSVACRTAIIGGVSCEWVVSPAAEGSTHTVVYLHGGAFVAGSPRTHMDLAWRLSEASGMKVLLVDYRLAPAHVFPAALDDLVAVYRDLLASDNGHRRLAFAGDSAGANLAISGILRLRQLELPLPAACICLSPWVDLTHSGPTFQANAHKESMLPTNLLVSAAHAYAAGTDPTEPLVSPIFADLSGFPPMLIYAASEEVLLDDAARIVGRARSAGVEVTYQVWDRQAHAFPALAAIVPEARYAVAQIGVFLRWTLERPRIAEAAPVGSMA